jgi:type III secretory pathway component EscV
LVPIAIDLSPELSQSLAPQGGLRRLEHELLPAARERFFAETGIALPAISVRTNVAGLAARVYVVHLQEVPVTRGEVALDGGPPEEAIVLHLLQVLRRHGHEFVGIEETQSLLDQLARTQPALVREVVPKVVSPARLAEILRRLAEEGVSLRNLREILGALADRAPTESDPVALTEHVRAALRRPITFAHTGGSGVLRMYSLDPMIEDTVRESIQHNASGNTLAIEPELASDIVKAVGRAVRGNPAPVIVTAADIRWHLRHLLESELREIAVLSYQELEPDVKLQSLGRITVAAS